MYHIKKRALALAAAVLLLAGCGSRGESPLDQSQPPQSAVSTSASAREERPAGTDKSTQSPADGSGDSSGDQAPEDDPQQAQDPDPSQQADPGQPEPQAQQPQEDLFAQLPQTFVFSSGAGAWSTQISIKADGTFTGHYEDADAGDAGDGYDSTVYQCDFSGRFTPPVEQKPHIYSMELEFIHLYDTPGNEVIRDQVRYVSTDPYGLDNAQEVMLYCPGAKLADLPEYFLLWTNQGPKEEVSPEDTLSFYGLYNVNESEGFAGYDG